MDTDIDVPYDALGVGGERVVRSSGSATIFETTVLQLTGLNWGGWGVQPIHYFPSLAWARSRFWFLTLGLDGILWSVGGVVEVALDVGHRIKGAMMFCVMLEPQWSKRQGDAFTLQMQETSSAEFHLLLDSRQGVNVMQIRYDNSH